MTDTPRSLAYLLATLFADGQVGTISAQKVRDAIVTLSLLLGDPAASTNVTAAGTTQGTATALTGFVSAITAGALDTGVILQNTVGALQRVSNATNSEKKVYPPSGVAIDALGANNPVLLPAGSSVDIVVTSGSAATQQAYPADVVSSLRIGAHLFFTEMTAGDFWITSNAFWDGTNWQRQDTGRTSFALNWQTYTDIPGETNLKGLMFLRAVSGTNPISSTFGSFGGWEFLYVMTEFRDIVIGGYGIEVDGAGTVPYGRFQHATVGGIKKTGILTNVYLDESARDGTSYNSWSVTVEDDGTSTGDCFRIKRAPSGASLVWTELFKLTSGGVLTVNGAAVGGSSTETANLQTASYTLVLGDAGKIIEMNVASANTLTIPPNSSVAFPIGQLIDLCQVGLGQCTVTAGAGVTLRTATSTTATRAQWSTLTLRQRATDEWVVSGDTA